MNSREEIKIAAEINKNIGVITERFRVKDGLIKKLEEKSKLDDMALSNYRGEIDDAFKEIKELKEQIEKAYKAGHRNHISDEDVINEYWESYCSANLLDKN